jgi:SagB-type dehydrogenase family enzyme
MARGLLKDQTRHERISLPRPRYQSQTSVEKALSRRRSVRDFRDRPLVLSELSQLLWAAQGITHRSGYRAAPSAGALYPLDVYVLAGNITGIDVGTYKYLPHEHSLLHDASGDKRMVLRHAALDQPAVSGAAAVLVFCALYGRTTGKYGKRGIRYVHMEAGHAAQNVYLQAVALQLGTVVLGAFDDEQVKEVLTLREQQPLYLMPVGKR